MKNKILNRWSIIFGSVLSFFGIFVGSFACAYGPPGGSEEEYKKMYDLKSEVEELQSRVNKRESEKVALEREIANLEAKIKELNREQEFIIKELEDINK